MPSDQLQDRVRRIREDLAGETIQYVGQLKEEGLKAILLVPILEDHLGFRPLDDLHFEFSPSHTTNVRFDIVARTDPTTYCVFETKELDALATQRSQKSARDQMAMYLESQDDFYFGLLTDFRRWQVFIARYYIERVAHVGKKIDTIKEKVPCCFEFDLENEHFWDYLSIFARESFHRNLTQLAKGVANVALSKRGGIAWGNVFSGIDIQRQKECGEALKAYVVENFGVTKGEFWNKVTEGIISSGTKIEFNDGIIAFSATILSDGCLRVEPQSVKQIANFLEVRKKYPKFVEVMADWTEEESRTYAKRASIHKDLLGQQRVWEKFYVPHWTGP